MLVCKKRFPLLLPILILKDFWHCTWKRINRNLTFSSTKLSQPSLCWASSSQSSSRQLKSTVKIFYKDNYLFHQSFMPTGCRRQQHWMLEKVQTTPLSISQKERCTSLRGLAKHAGSAHLYSPLASNGKAPGEEARHPQTLDIAISCAQMPLLAETS